MKIMGWVKKSWVSLLTILIALGALAVSIYALHLDSEHFKESSELSRTALKIEREHYQELRKEYEELTKPHTKHDEIYNRLVILDGKIERVEQIVSDLESEHHLREAKELRDQAELSWDEGHYPEADKFISQAHVVLARIPLPPAPAPPAPPPPAPPAPAPVPEVNVWLLIIIAVVTIIVVGGVLWFFSFRRPEDK